MYVDGTNDVIISTSFVTLLVPRVTGDCSSGE